MWPVSSNLSRKASSAPVNMPAPLQSIGQSSSPASCQQSKHSDGLSNWSPNGGNCISRSQKEAKPNSCCGRKVFAMTPRKSPVFNQPAPRFNLYQYYFIQLVVGVIQCLTTSATSPVISSWKLTSSIISSTSSLPSQTKPRVIFSSSCAKSSSLLVVDKCVCQHAVLSPIWFVLRLKSRPCPTPVKRDDEVKSSQLSSTGLLQLNQSPVLKLTCLSVLMPLLSTNWINRCDNLPEAALFSYTAPMHCPN
uniref:Uncharacterized protein n=1 Tax=Ditylenchus dipsaci TaxID=166011 RepID=A0A915DB57_9BILA